MRLADPSDRLRRVRGSRSSSRIVGALQDPSPEVARAAIVRLVELDGPRAAGVLRARLLIADLQVVADVAAALRALGDIDAVGVAIGGLSDESYPRRLAGARALGVLGDPRAREPLRRSLRDEIAGVRMAALDALGKLEPDEDTALACLPLLTDPNSQVRTAAVRAVACLAPTRLAAASALAEDPDCLVRLEVARHVGSIAGSASQRLFADSDAGVREAAALAAGPQHAEMLARLLATDANDNVRRAAARTLGGCDAGVAADGLVGGIEDPDAVVRAAALHALERSLTRRGAVARLSRELASARPLRRRCSVYALAHLHGREASSEVWRLADDPEPDVRLALIQAAPAVASDPEALLLYMTTDPDRSVQDSARNRLQRWQVGGSR